MEKSYINVQIGNEKNEVERLAILLAMTQSHEEEKYYVDMYQNMGYKCVVTGVAGMNDEVGKKLVGAVVGASLNERVIDKTQHEMHAVIHATADAAMGIRVDSPVSQSFQLKATIVRKDNWLCVAMYGNMAVHKVTNHKTIGIGVMHL
mgnify:CR=1 FL=1